MRQTKVHNTKKNQINSMKKGEYQPKLPRDVSKNPYENKNRRLGSTNNVNEVYIESLKLGAGGVTNTGETKFQNDVNFMGNVTCYSNFEVLAEQVSTDGEQLGASVFSVNNGVVNLGNSTAESLQSTDIRGQTARVETELLVEASVTDDQLGMSGRTRLAPGRVETDLMLSTTVEAETMTSTTVESTNVKGKKLRVEEELLVEAVVANGNVATSGRTRVAPGLVETDTISMTSGTVLNAPSNGNDVVNKEHVDPINVLLAQSRSESMNISNGNNDLLAGFSSAKIDTKGRFANGKFNNNPNDLVTVKVSAVIQQSLVRTPGTDGTLYVQGLDVNGNVVDEAFLAQTNTDAVSGVQAVTVDWVVLTTAVVGLGIASLRSVSDGVTTTFNNVRVEMSSQKQ